MVERFCAVLRVLKGKLASLNFTDLAMTSNGVLFDNLGVGSLLMRKVAVINASSQYFKGREVVASKDNPISVTCLCLRSAVPLCCVDKFLSNVRLATLKVGNIVGQMAGSSTIRIPRGIIKSFWVDNYVTQPSTNLAHRSITLPASTIPASSSGRSSTLKTSSLTCIVWRISSLILGRVSGLGLGYVGRDILRRFNLRLFKSCFLSKKMCLYLCEQLAFMSLSLGDKVIINRFPDLDLILAVPVEIKKLRSSSFIARGCGRFCNVNLGASEAIPKDAMINDEAG
ncbi:uncharacterized protein G2W53_007493 [Senna tora]|uniref:Uncharacterized protein n=1 Tax=Senna tora TaxID=362788 RepID=A0A835CF02_9FABA|nr:uncharacterized protein G2W53_007493 [Senna tora]